MARPQISGATRGSERREVVEWGRESGGKVGEFHRAESEYECLVWTALSDLTEPAESLIEQMVVIAAAQPW
jgi:hypothetical protein